MPKKAKAELTKYLQNYLFLCNCRPGWYLRKSSCSRLFCQDTESTCHSQQEPT